MTKKRSQETEIKNYIVGIGASAGGLEALHELFDNMPPDTNFSFVVIQHLSPDHKSLLSELLAKHTMMQVFEAEEGTVLKPNCIYVIPSRKLLTIRDGALHLDEKLKTRQPNDAIDIFFESLAEDQKHQAGAIILSGTGTDGTRGIEAIKRQGGFVVVQDPVTAAFDGMPNSALATGVADLVLAPEMMADEIVEYLHETPLVKSFSLNSQKEEAILREILQLLQARTGHDFINYKRPTLFRRIAKRMAETSLASLEEYRQFLRKNDDEIKLLANEFLINVTKFFRDSEAFDIIRTKIIPSVLTGKEKNDIVKIWSMACSSGEEAYSLAMLFNEYTSKHEPEVQVKIFATDIDAQALETASKGVYPLSAGNDIPPAFLEKYFTREENTYRVSPTIRKMVVFANHNILKDPPFSKVDLISCRNMLIYLDTYLQHKILNKFYFAMNLNSYLFMGTSEHIGPLSPAMEEISRKWKIYRCISKTNAIERETFLSPLENRVYTPSIAPKSKNPLNNMADLFKETIVEERAIAGILLDREFNVKQATGNFKEFLQFPQDNFNFNILKLVVPDLAIALGVSLRKAVAQNEKISVKRIVVGNARQEKRYINVVIKPYLQNKDYLQPFLFVVMEEEKLEEKLYKTVTDPTITSSGRIEELERELNDTRENLQAVIEELESANEEMQSSNEEMISTNEELQSTNEELQSLNEELHTVSAEHQNKIKELLELNDDLDNYFSNANVGQIFIDPKLLVRKFSPGIKPVINLIGTDMGRSIADITTNIKNYNLINDIKEVMRSGKVIEKEIVLQNDHSHYLMRINPYIKKDKTPDGTVINFIDVTESKKLSGMIEAVFNSSTNGISAKKTVRNKENQIVDFEYLIVNKRYEELYDVKSEKILGSRMTEVLPLVNNDYLRLCISVVETGTIARTETYLSKKDMWMETTIAKMHDGIVSTHIDITEKKKSEQMLAQSYEELQNASRLLTDSNVQLERSNMDLMQFASVASHDLKEPLRKIQAFGNLLESKLAQKLEENELGYLQKMVSASGRMQVLIEDVLTLSKLSNNHLPRTKVQLSQVIKHITEDLEILIKEKNAEIRISEMPEIEAVPGQVHQLFQNLISNALKFNDKKVPVISIRNVPVTEQMLQEMQADEHRKFVAVEVSDNGIGFEQEYKETIFGLFQRLNGRLYDGTGIGLAIVKKILENHGGFIQASSTINEGTVFTILFPA